eukprot:scaffold90428_cov38-Phaeocystis_antarctica.AAC.1
MKSSQGYHGLDITARLGEKGTHPRVGPRSLRGVSRPRARAYARAYVPCLLSTTSPERGLGREASRGLAPALLLAPMSTVLSLT